MGEVGSRQEKTRGPPENVRSKTHTARVIEICKPWQILLIQLLLYDWLDILNDPSPHFLTVRTLLWIRDKIERYSKFLF
jgi:hypothetical protein